jgi:dienelactone hydrolase
MSERVVDYALEGKPHQGLLVFDDAVKAPAPTVMVFHAWDGRGEAMDAMARRVAGLGYNAFAVDLYGKGIVGTSTEECQALMTPLVTDRARLRALVLASVATLAGLPEVDASKIAAIGFCFGGLCVLDLARAGAPVTAVASFHGLFTPPGLPSTTPIAPRVIAFHGWDDPMAPPESVVAFGQEFTDGKADWQLHAYGSTLHGFMMEEANMPAMGIQYNALSASRAWATLEGFLAETL